MCFTELSIGHATANSAAGLSPVRHKTGKTAGRKPVLGLGAALSAKLRLELGHELRRRRELLRVVHVVPEELQRVAGVGEGPAEVAGDVRGPGGFLRPAARRLLLGQRLLIDVGGQQAVDPGGALAAIAARRLAGIDADAAGARRRAEARLGREIGLE
jgi:hypothetical protein